MVRVIAGDEGRERLGEVVTTGDVEEYIDETLVLFGGFGCSGFMVIRSVFEQRGTHAGVEGVRESEETL